MGMAIVGVSTSLFTLTSPQPGSIMEVRSNDIPADASIVGIELRGDTFWITVSSPSIPEGMEGATKILNGPTIMRTDAPLTSAEWAAIRNQPAVDARMQRYRHLVAMGKMTINMCRSIEGLPTIGETGDQYVIPAATISYSTMMRANVDDLPTPEIVELDQPRDSR